MVCLRLPIQLTTVNYVAQDLWVCEWENFMWSLPENWKKNTLHLAMEEVPWLTTDGWTPSSSSNLILIRKKSRVSPNTHSTSPFQNHSPPTHKTSKPKIKNSPHWHLHESTTQILETWLLISRKKLESLQRPIPFAKDLQEGPLFSTKKPETHFLLHFIRLIIIQN